MPARVILPGDEPDLLPDEGEYDASTLQDCINIVNAYERGCHFSAREDAVLAPLVHHTRSIQSWARHGRNILSSRLLPVQAVSSKDLSEQVTGWVDECIPCKDRVKLALETLPSEANLKFLEDDIKDRVKQLQSLAKLLNNHNQLGNICSLLEALDAMCLPDLQRIVAILMATLTKTNVNLADQQGLVVSLILPIFMPLITRVSSMVSHFNALVLSPVDCILSVLEEQARKIPGGSGAVSSLADVETREQLAVGGALELAAKHIQDGRNQLETKLQFYEGVVKKALGDVNGAAEIQIASSQNKLEVLSLISVVRSLIELKRKGGKLCEAGRPDRTALDEFFSNFFNPKSRWKLGFDTDGNITVSDPHFAPIEVANGSGKIITYEPEALLTQPSTTTYHCSFHTDTLVTPELVNQWIRELMSEETK